MSNIDIDTLALREAAKQATQDEWVAYILPGHNGIYPARTSEGRHCGYFIDWPSVCQGRESINMSIRTYAVNCNDAWLNTEGDDISGSYVKYKDHQEVVAALEAKCAALAAENAGLKAICDDRRRFIMNGVQTGYIKVPTAETAPDLETIRIAISPQKPIPATDAFLAEVRAQGVDMARNAMIDFVDGEVGPNKNVPGLIRGAEICVSIAEQLRKGGNQ
ncbi:TPA: ead/Ea22-like family protein [Escherichia coli]|uniref:ead/Ea22-like family protein n=1 Tax=Escherichia coli TaxID=562 RepID=UPI0015DC4B0E|nr:ead/Ea22-like family protein [Escherichia coli]EIW8787494.1 ead/Ea22-like family protein [Klebsiella pneumoniae]HAN2533874.1 ead/Ea22-like family protein [Escherichia coli O25b:H4-ST131]EIW8944505.1 ead/Ea22-like family protein [Klebsiella pneumoniae]MDM8779881.1 ead/Ea22-like family protein [Escherichia coli]WNU45259.1 ead/Ea22-like family protein [Escherichia coli]